MIHDPSPRPATRAAVHSFTLEYPAGDPADAERFFAAKLAFEIDSSDLRLDLERNTARIIVLDVRPARDHAQCRVPGAVSLPWRAISADATSEFPKDALLVTYCWGHHCNASTKAALKLTRLGFRVKELVGGLVFWRNDGLPVEGTLGEAAPLYG